MIKKSGFIGRNSLVTGESIDYEQLNATLTQSDASCKMVLVESGTYYMVAIKNINSNLMYARSIDLMSRYDDRDTLIERIVIPRQVMVEAGKETHDVDIDALYIAPTSTIGSSFAKLSLQILI